MKCVPEDPPMRTVIALMLSFGFAIAAWVDVGTKAMYEAWSIYEASTADLYVHAGRSGAAEAALPAGAPATPGFAALYQAGLGDLLARRAVVQTP
jgi:hypothetical protein